MNSDMFASIKCDVPLIFGISAMCLCVDDDDEKGEMHRLNWLSLWFHRRFYGLNHTIFGNSTKSRQSIDWMWT